jgi:membrane-bound serine protease (ClpP class)
LKIAAFCLLASALSAAAPSARAEPSEIRRSGSLYVLTAKGIITPVMAQYLRDGLKEAEEGGAAAAMIRLDTPGGLLDATRDIVGDVLNAPFPVIVYVAPQGARAASAGVFITLAADVAAMAPQTHIGAAHPVSIGGGLPGQRTEKSTAPAAGGAMEEKAVSDAAAYARGLAAAKGRNAEWAEKAVRDSVSLTAEEALKLKVVDFVAADEDGLLKALSGRSVEKQGRAHSLDLSEAPRKALDMNAVLRLLQALVNPNAAYIFLMLGFYALIYEFASPGVGFGAAAGVICLLLAFYGLQVLPVNYAGLGLLLAGVIFLLLDLKLPTGGLLSIGGVLSLVLGSLMLFDSPEPYLRVSLELVAGTALATAGFFGFALKKVLETRTLKPSSGKEALIGKTGEVRPGGMVFLNGELWTLDSPRALSAGDQVKVTAVQGLRLSVEKIGEGRKRKAK